MNFDAWKNVFEVKKPKCDGWRIKEDHELLEPGDVGLLASMDPKAYLSPTGGVTKDNKHNGRSINSLKIDGVIPPGYYVWTRTSSNRLPLNALFKQPLPLP